MDNVNDVKSFSIMVVDDDKGIRGMMKFILDDLHHRNEVEKYEICHNAEKALARLMMQEGKFNVIITDVNMPGMSGIELVKAIKREYPDIVCIVYSGRDHFAEARKIGAHFFFKPYNLYELLEMAKEALGAK